MEDISRELPPEPQVPELRHHRGKGPADGLDEALAAEIPERELLGDSEDPHNRLAAVGVPERVILEGDAEVLPPDDPTHDWRSAQRFGGGGSDPVVDAGREPLFGPPVPATSAAAGQSAEPLAEGAADATEVEPAPELHGPPPPAEFGVETRAPSAPRAPIAPADTTGEARSLIEPAEVSRVVMAVLLTSREALTVLRLAQVCNTTQRVIQDALVVLEQDLRNGGFPLHVQRNGDAVRLLTVPDVFPYLDRLRGMKKVERLSHAALETLAVVAYRQPVMRAEIEAIRGVKVGPMLRMLLEHKLVDVVGRADVLGRPLQYGTTPVFLDRFGLGSLEDLPSIKEFRSLD